MLREILKKSENKKDRPGISSLLRSLYFLIICLFCLFAIGYAWFLTAGPNTNIEEFEFVAIEAAGFQASLDGSVYKNEVTITYPESLKLAPVSGDGMQNLMYYPLLPAGSNDPDEALEWLPTTYDETADENMFYLFKVYFQATKPGYAVVSNVSVDPAAAPENRQGSNYKNSSGEDVTVSGTVDNPIVTTLTRTLDADSDEITKDYIAAAARVSITNNGDNLVNGARHFLIIPNETFALSSTMYTNIQTGAKTYAYSMAENQAVDKSKPMYHFYPTTMDKITYSERNMIYYFGNDVNETSAVYVLRLEKVDGEELYRGDINVCLWIEGYDDEATDLFEGGEVKLSLLFEYREDMEES